MSSWRDRFSSSSPCGNVAEDLEVLVRIGYGAVCVGFVVRRLGRHLEQRARRIGP